MNDEEERLEIHRRLELLKEKLEMGEIVIAEHLADDFRISLGKVRYAEDGLVNLDTVDGRIRSLTLMVAHMKDREEWKEAISLRDIQDAYFRNVEHAFGEIYSGLYAIARNSQSTVDSTQFSHWFVSKEELLGPNIEFVDNFIQLIKEFWENASEPIWIHSEDQIALKAVFGGETFPIDSKNIASTCGLYVDTIYLPCPFTKIFGIYPHWSSKERVQNVLKQALSLLKYKELALADVDTPIVVILPDRFPLDEQYREFVGQLGEFDGVKHTGQILGRDFESLDEVNEYCQQFGSFDDLIEKLAKPDRLLFDTEWEKESPHEQISKFLESEVKPLGLDPTNIIYAQSFMRMNQANDVLQRSRQIRGSPLIDAPTSWRYFNWKLEYDAETVHEAQRTDIHMVRGLQSAAAGEMQWLGNIPPDALIEMRKEGAIEEIRQILSSGVTEIAEARPTNFFRTGDQVVENIHRAFDEHQSNLRKLRDKRLRFAGHDIGSFLVTGTLEIAAACTGNPLFGLSLLSVGQFTDVPKLKDFPKIAKELAGEGDRLNKSPVGLLFRHKT